MRGQLFSFDFLFAVSLLVFIFGLALFVSDQISASINNAEQQRDVQISATNSLNQLLQTPGNPSNWDYLSFSDQNIKSIGLVQERSVLDRHKVDQFFSVANSGQDNYRLIKRIIGIDLPSVDFNLIISNSTAVFYQINLQPPGNATIYAQQRSAILDGQTVSVALNVWVKQ